jgi:hypothetical protein
MTRREVPSFESNNRDHPEKWLDVQKLGYILACRKSEYRKSAAPLWSKLLPELELKVFLATDLRNNVSSSYSR